MKIVVCGGGTAGHVYPGLASAAALKKIYAKIEIDWIGAADGIEAALVPADGYRFYGLKVKGLKRSISADALSSLTLMISASRQARRLLRKINPEVIIGLGGYASLPTLAAGRRRYKIILLEQNTVPGLVNRLAGRWARVIAAAYEESRPFFRDPRRVVVTGNPVRPQVAAVEREAGLRALGLTADRTNILIFGGSGGARRLNQATVELYDKTRHDSRRRIIHITGKRDYEEIKKMAAAVKRDADKLDYRLYEYIPDIWSAYAAADLIVCRAGATTLAEITTVGLPALLVPYPYATHNHQWKNAEVLAKAGAARLLKDEELNGVVLAEKMEEILSEPDVLSAMAAASRSIGRPDAARRVAELVKFVVESDG